MKVIEMILGRIIGLCTTRRFNFDAKENVSTFSYVQVPHKDGDILAQIVEITKGSNTTAHCTVLGLVQDKKLLHLRSPLEPGVEVILAQDELIQDALRFEGKAGAYIGTLDGKDIPVQLVVCRFNNFTKLSATNFSFIRPLKRVCI